MRSFFIALSLVFSLFAHGYAVQGWNEMTAANGEFSVSFPQQPQYVKERMYLPAVNSWMDYEIYLSILQPKAIFLLLIASYPKKIEPEQVQGCLESFLKGMTARNPDNQVIFADMNKVNGKHTLEFFLKSTNALFRGRVFMEKGKLYLLAVECKEEKEIESLYHPFSESFRIK